MSFLDHLEELRSRLLKSLVSLAVGFGIAWNFRNEIFHFMVAPLRTAYPGLELIATSPTESLMLYMKMAFFVGIFLAALGGAFTAPMISVQPGVSVGVIIVSFAVVIIGGLGSIPGAAIGALIVGMARSFAVHLWPVAELFSIYIVMAVVLMFRPEGLFQQTQARKI